MQIVGFNLLEIKGKRKEFLDRNFDMKVNLSMKNVKKIDFDVKEDANVLGFHFEFSVECTGENGKIEIEGVILAMLSKKEADEILKTWEKEKKLSDKIRTFIYNIIFSKCNIKALELEEELNLPTHIPMPLLRESTKEETKEQKKKEKK